MTASARDRPTRQLLELAEDLATAAHAGQVDKAGLPYIGHPARVVAHARAAGGTDEVLAAAWLHDVLEDTPTTPDRLRTAGIPDDVVHAVIALTKRSGELPADYFARLNADPIAVRVKHADLADNTDPSRLQRLDESTRRRLAAKYEHARELLAPVARCAGFAPRPAGTATTEILTNREKR